MCIHTYVCICVFSTYLFDSKYIKKEEPTKATYTSTNYVYPAVDIIILLGELFEIKYVFLNLELFTNTKQIDEVHICNVL
jgi:hypothetical protein